MFISIPTHRTDAGHGAELSHGVADRKSRAWHVPPPSMHDKKENQRDMSSDRLERSEIDVGLANQVAGAFSYMF